jgi:hypothetical protein
VSFGIPVRNGLAVGLLASTFLTSRRSGGPFSGAALYLNMLSGSLDSRVTFSRGSNATLVDGTGRIVYAPANLLTWSEDFTNAAWTKNQGGVGIAPAVTADAGVAPDGTATADRVQLSLGGGTATADISDLRQAPTTASARHIFSFWVKSFDGVSTYNMLARDSNGITNQVVVTGTWTRYSVAANYNAGTSTIGLGIRGGQTPTNSSTADILIWGAQLEPVTYQTVPGPYVATTSAAYYGPRFDYNPVTLAPLGLLIEEARTNLLLNSQLFSGWTVVGLNAFGSGSSTTAIASPDGTVTGNFLQENSSASRHFVTRTVTGASSSTVYTFSAFVKFASRRYVVLAIGSSLSGTTNASYSLVFDVQNGVFVSATNTTGTPSATAYSITNFGNGWYRVNVTMQSGASDNVVFGSLALSDSATPSYVGEVPSYTGNGTSGSYFWGAQLEAGSFATSYYPTVASQVTRNADVATMSGTNFSSWYNQPEGTIVWSGDFAVNNSNRLVSIDAGAVARTADIYGTTAGAVSYYKTSDAQQIQFGSGISLNTVFSAAVAIKLNDYIGAVNGTLGGADTTTGAVATADRLSLGHWNNTGFLNGHIRQIAYFNSRLPNAQLQALTAPPLITSLSLDFINGVYEG